MVNNTSGHGSYAEIPEGIDKWNWGAFFLTWIWGIGNHSYIAFLVFVPFANIIMPFYLGIKGNELAWKNVHYYDVEDLHRTQRKWAKAGCIVALIIVLITGLRIYKEVRIQNEVNAYTKIVVDLIKKDDGAVKMLGADFDVSTADGFELNSIRMAPAIMIHGKDDFYTVNVEEQDGRITRIEINPFDNSGEKYVINLGDGD